MNDNIPCDRIPAPKHTYCSICGNNDHNDNAVGLCWNCSKASGFHDTHCPHCGATNPNVDFDTAMLELEDNINRKKTKAAWTGMMKPYVDMIINEITKDITTDITTVSAGVISKQDVLDKLNEINNLPDDTDF